MYTLYFKRNEKKIEVKKAKKGLQHLSYTEECAKYNHCYYICLKRKPLIDKAKEIKQAWIDETEKDLEAIKAIVI